MWGIGVASGSIASAGYSHVASATRAQAYLAARSLARGMPIASAAGPYRVGGGGSIEESRDIPHASRASAHGLRLQSRLWHDLAGRERPPVRRDLSIHRTSRESTGQSEKSRAPRSSATAN